MSQNYIYHNENLFRITDLYKKTSILFVFRDIFTKLQLLAKNHFHDLASKTQILKNSILRAMTFKFFLEINISLKSGQRCGLSIPNNDFSIRHILRLNFGFFGKKCISVQFCGNLHVEHSGYHRDVKSIDIKK